MYRYPGRNMGDGNMGGGGGGMLPVPYDMGGILPRGGGGGGDGAATGGIQQQPPVPITALASALANAPPEQQRTVSKYEKVD